MEIFDRTIIETREKSYVMLFMKIIVYNIVKSAIVCVRLILPWGGYKIDPIEQLLFFISNRWLFGIVGLVIIVFRAKDEVIFLILFFGRWLFAAFAVLLAKTVMKFKHVVFYRSFTFFLLIRVHVDLGHREASLRFSLNWARSIGYSDSVDLKGAWARRIRLFHL